MNSLKTIRLSRIIFSVVIVIMTLSIVSGCNSHAGKQNIDKNQSPAAVPSTEKQPENNIIKETDRIVSADSVQALIKGRWLRTDGDYTIEIFSVSDRGKMDAGYFNPGPIHVGSSGWKEADGNIYVEIELRDVKYPGSKYNMVYDIKRDRLAGNYFQAVQGINYDVEFVRKK